LRDQRGERTLPPESNNALTPQREMKALRNHFLAAGNRPAAWPHPSLCGEVGPAPAGPRRAQPDRYPDLGLGLASAFPSRLAEQWLVEVCSPLQWRNRLRSHGVPCRLIVFWMNLPVHRFQRTRVLYPRRDRAPSQICRSPLGAHASCSSS
jgi:hypothetical protein